MEHDPWGRVLTDTHPGFQPFGFAGGLYDGDPGLVRFGARDYKLGSGAVDSEGSGGGDASLYNYVGGDPLNFVDATDTVVTEPRPSDLPEKPIGDDKLQGLGQDKLKRLYDELNKRGLGKEVEKFKKWQKSIGQRPSSLTKKIKLKNKQRGFYVPRSPLEAFVVLMLMLRNIFQPCPEGEDCGDGQEEADRPEDECP